MRALSRLVAAALVSIAALHIASPVTASDAQVKPVLRVGIIGSGITGASSAYFLHEALSDDYDVRFTVWERDHRIGGRIADVHVGAHRLESGASIMHTSNRYMREFATLLNLTLHDPPPKLDGRVAVWNGETFPLQLQGGWWGWDAVTVFWRYGFDYMRLAQIVRNVAKAFTSIYSLQDRGSAYSSPQAMLTAMGVWHHTQVSLHSYIHEQKEWVSGCDRAHPESELLLNELAVAATRVNYNQDLEVNALAGAVGLIPLTDSRLWSVDGGNARIVEGLFSLVDANVKLGHSVRFVERVARAGGPSPFDGETNEIRVRGRRISRADAEQAAFNNSSAAEGIGNSTATLGDEFSDTVDLVIVATPLEFAPDLVFRFPRGNQPVSTSSSSSSSTNPDADEDLLPQPDFPGRDDDPRPFQTTHATFVSGRLRSAPFFPHAAAAAASAAAATAAEKKRNKGGVAPASTPIPPVSVQLEKFAQMPGTILTSENATQHFTSISAYAEEPSFDATPVGGGSSSSSSSGQGTGRRVYKIFSRDFFGNRRINDYFSEVDPALTTRFAWKAYPKYNVPEAFVDSFELYSSLGGGGATDGTGVVFYPPALEAAASCMEVQTIASKNVAMLIAQQWREKLHQLDAQEHDEL